MSGRWTAGLRLVRRGSPALLALALVALLATPVLTPSSASIASDEPEGRSSLASIARESGYDVRVTAISPTEATSWEPRSTLIVVGDSPASFLPTGAQTLADWSSEGGLLVADGQGGALPVAKTLGIPVTSQRILDGSLDDDPTRVGADVTVEDRTYETTFEQPFAIGRDRLEGTWTPTAETRDESFVDLEGNGQLDRTDTRGPFVVGVRGEPNTVVLTSGASLENEALAEEETRAAVQALLASLAPDGGTVVVDASHADHGLAGDAALAVLRPTVSLLGSPLWGTLCLAGLVAGTAGILLRRAESVEAWSQAEDAASEVTSRRSLDLGFMSEALDSMVEDAGGGDVPDRHRDLLQRLRETNNGTGSSEA